MIATLCKKAVFIMILDVDDASQVFNSRLFLIVVRA
jgi:hypothetical protein